MSNLYRCKTVAFLTLGCKVNSYETEAMQKLFEQAGYTAVDFSEHADVYVVNTCTVTNIADRKSRQMLHKAKKMNHDAIVVAVGCYVQAAKETLEKDESIDIVIGNNKKKDIIAILNDYYIGKREFENSIVDLSQEAEYEELSIESVTEKTRAYIKIQDGCNQFCSYCIIPYARGRVRSRLPEDVIAEVIRLVQKGYKEIVLTGIHLSSYGIDFKDNQKALEKTNSYTYEDMTKKQDVKPYLLQLIINLSKIDGLERIRLGSLEPRIITEEFVKTLSNSSKLCPHFHLSLQSGCDETLKRMNRKYNTKEYYDKCELLRKYFDNPAITTDVIVGFPGETNEEFGITKAFLKKVAFSKMHIFKYSVRKGTRAEQMTGQVQEEVKSERSTILMALEEEMEHEYKLGFVDKTEKFLIEEIIVIDGIEYQVGHTERYLKLAVKSEKDLTNQIIQGKIIKQLNKDIMFCEIID